jgi:nitroreductase
MSKAAAYPPGLTMPIGEALFTQRAIRRLRPDPVSDADLRTILDAAVKAPSGGNQQPLRFLVIREREKIAAFGKLYHEAWWAKRWDEHRWSQPEDIPAEDKVHRAAMGLADEIGNAPVIVLAFCLQKNRANSVFPAVQNLLLAARALGIGSTLTTLHPKVLKRVYALLQVPEGVEFHCCIPLGYPRGRFGPTQRLPTSQTVFYDAWCQPPPWA